VGCEKEISQQQQKALTGRKEHHQRRRKDAWRGRGDSQGPKKKFSWREMKWGTEFANQIISEGAVKKGREAAVEEMPTVSEENISKLTITSPWQELVRKQMVKS